MSTHWTTWAWEQKFGDRKGHKVVLLALADHAGHDGVCWPEGASLSERTEYAVQTVRKYITELEEAGYLVKIERRRKRGGEFGGWVYQLTHTSRESGAHTLTTTATPVALVGGYHRDPSRAGSATPVALVGGPLLTCIEESLEPSSSLPETSSGRGNPDECMRPSDGSPPVRVGTGHEHADRMCAALVDACRLDWADMPKRARTTLATAAKELAALRPPVQPAEVARRAGVYGETFPNATLTPSALVKHWPALSRAARRTQPSGVPKSLSGLDAALRRAEGR